MKILLTGGCGFIFSHVAEHLSSKHEIHIVDGLLDGSNKYLIKEFEEKGIKVIIKKCEYLKKEDIHNDYDCIIHGAAESNVDKSIDNPSSVVVNNIKATENMLNLALLQKNLKAFIYIGTDEIHGDTDEVVDGSKHQPRNPYAVSKSAGSELTHAYHVTYDLPTIELRFCNVIGKRQDKTKLIPKIIHCLDNNEKFPIYDSGMAKREYIDVRDICTIIDKILDKHGYFNFNIHCIKERLLLITTGKSYSILEVINKVETIYGKHLKIKNGTRKGHDMNYKMKPACFLKGMCYNSIESTIKWILKNN